MPEEEEFEYTKGVIRIRKSKNSQCIAQTKPPKKRFANYYTEN